MNKTFKRGLGLAMAAAIAFPILLSGCQKKAETPVSKTEVILGTVCTIKIYDHISDTAFEQVFAKLRELEDKMSANKDESEVIDINKAAGIGYVKVSEDTFNVIKQGLYFSSLYDKFDITIGPVVKLWNIGFDNARIPEDSEIKAKLPLVDYKKVLIDENEKKIMLKDKGMMIDLGGIAKGYAADEAVEVLKKNGVEHAIVNLGGNVMTLGGRPDGKPWTIGVQHPFANRGDYIGTIKVEDKTVVTSGIYERYIKQDDKIYHHIIDKATGYPVDNNLLSATIVTDKSIKGDGMSKVFAMGLENALEYVKTLKDVDAIFITKDNKVYLTPGLKENFQLTDKSFEVIKK
jgi:thiamine biosynthesis lipoprotein